MVEKWVEIVEEVNRCLRIAGVYLTWDIAANAASMERQQWPPQARLVFEGGGLFGLLTVQLLMVLTRSDELVICSACGAPFLPGRRRRAGERCYCTPCRASGATQREWWRARARMRKTNGEPVSGVSPDPRRRRAK